MMDERSKQYLIDVAEKRCTCANCMKEKALKEDRALRASKPSIELPSKFFRKSLWFHNRFFENPSGFTIDFSKIPLVSQ